MLITKTRTTITAAAIAAALSLTGATGDGPATQADCDRYADAINSWGQAADTAANHDDMINAVNNASALEDKALDAGCFLVY